MSFAFLPLLILPALGVQFVTEQAVTRLPLRSWVPVVPAVLFWGLLAMALAAPYRSLFGMKDKLSPFSEIRDWLVSHLPEGGLYVWRNGYNLRELPQSYPVPGRQPAFASYPNAGIPASVLTREMNQARSIFERFPFSVMLADAGDEKEPYWTWMRDFFARREVFRNEAVSRLWRWGLSPHGMKVVESPTFVAYHNSEADVLGRLAASPQAVVWPVGPSWQYVQTRDGQLFIMPLGAGTLRVLLPPGPPQTASLALLGVALEAGSFTAKPVPGTGASGSLKTASFTKGGQVELKLGPFVLPGGESQLELSQFPVDRPSLLLYAFSLSPVAEAEVGLDNRR